MQATSYDLLVVGSGPGGYVAAIRAAQLGLRTCLVERDQLGGICLNWGCIPTKSLLRSSDVLRTVRNASQFGVNVLSPTVDFASMIARSRSIASQLNKGVAHLMRKNAITVLSGHARLKGRGQVEVSGDGADSTVLKAKHIVLATGARPRALPGLNFDRDTVWSYRDALDPPLVPKRLLIVGGGAIGIEFASFYRSIGVDVTVVEKAGNVLPLEDNDISAHLATSLLRDGIKVHTKTAIARAERMGGEWAVQLEDSSGGGLNADVILVAAGIVGNVESLGLDETSVRVENTHIVVDAFGKTAEAGVYAIGDVAGPPWLAHKASHEGIICVENIAGLDPHPLDPQRVVSCTYAHPQVASVGLTEAVAKAAGFSLKTGKFPFAGNGKALAMGANSGFVKVVFDADSGELLGAHMVGDEVTEMINGFAIAQTLETTEADFFSTILPHPTMSEAMYEAVLAAYGRAIHV
jgi:dihydrolipoamide dehydrogenase